jgi:HlyD family secretion protein
VVPPQGILDLGDVRTMHAVAEVYEADVPRVRMGMRATVRVKGTGLVCQEARVVAIGQIVGRKVALDNDPVTDTDARVVEVRVALDPASSASASGLSNARVEVLIQGGP